MTSENLAEAESGAGVAVGSVESSGVDERFIDELVSRAQSEGGAVDR